MASKYTSEYYDYHELVGEVEDFTGKKVRDWAGKFTNCPSKQDYETGNFPEAKWAKEQGYDWTVLCGNHSTPDQIELRKKIYAEFEASPANLPYQDFWHYAINNIFYDVTNGCSRWFCPKRSLENVEDTNSKGESQEWIREVLRAFIAVMERDEMEDEIEVYIGW